MRGMLYRAFMAARFDRTTFRNVRGDQEAILNALGIVILAGMAAAIGMNTSKTPGPKQTPSTRKISRNVARSRWNALPTT